MKVSSTASAALLCEVDGSDAAHATAIATIAQACSRDVGLRLTVRRRATHRAARPAQREAIITLHLPASLAASQHPVWCLACRLACFCPDTRVSVLVRCDAAFGAKPLRRRAARAA